MGPLFFFTERDARVMAAFTEQILPGEDGSPGAEATGVVAYIDQMLAGFGRELQGVYRAGLAALQAEVSADPKQTFAELPAEQQTALVARLAETHAADGSDFLGQFFAIVREHTVQGYFGDPMYGGNRELAGWNLVGFPGAQWGYSAEQMAPGFDARRIPTLTVRDLYARIGEKQ